MCFVSTPLTRPPHPRGPTCGRQITLINRRRMAAPGATSAAATEGGGDSPAEGEENADGEGGQEADQAEAKPLTYYIDPSVPAEWREYMKSGVEAWRPAFQAAGLGEEAIRGAIHTNKACSLKWVCVPCVAA